MEINSADFGIARSTAATDKAAEAELLPPTIVAIDDADGEEGAAAVGNRHCDGDGTGDEEEGIALKDVGGLLEEEEQEDGKSNSSEGRLERFGGG